MDISHLPVCKKILMLSGVSLFNFSDIRNLFSELRLSIDLHLFLGLGTKNSWLKKATDV